MSAAVLSIRDFDSSPDMVRPPRHHDSGVPRLCIPRLDFEPGKCYAVIGKSGAGKTVLNSLLLGLPASHLGRAVRVGSMDWWDGAVSLRDSDFGTASRMLARWREIRHKGTLLYLPQILPDGRGYQMSTKDYLEQVIAALRRQAGSSTRNWPDDPFKTFPDELRGVLGKPVTSLSGGERRRAELWARLKVLGTLSQDRRLGLLILDEPTTGLDVPDERRYLEELRRRVAELPNLAVLVTTHALYFIDDHLPHDAKQPEQPRMPLFDRVCLVHKEPCSDSGPICRVTAATDSCRLCEAVMRRIPEKSVEDSMEAFVDWQAGLSGDDFAEKVASAYFNEAASK